MFLTTVIGLGSSPGFGWKDPSGTPSSAGSVETLPLTRVETRDYRGHVTCEQGSDFGHHVGHPQARPPVAQEGTQLPL